jgi:NAD(P)-dependent dehydrogenase (short-subunit alcohol dehydrogenase family)
VIGRLLDATVWWSFDRTGFRRHAARFAPIEVNMRGRVCLVTGASSGIGRATARALAGMGAEVWLLCRDAGRGAAALAAIRRQTGSTALRLVVLDVSDLDAVRAFVPPPRVDVLVHNAGMLADRRETTKDGLERTFATHVAGPHLLTAKVPAARVIFVSSGGMYTQRLRPELLAAPPRPFDGVAQYARCKRAQVVLAELWAERRPHSIVSAMHPGWADTPGVAASLPRFHARLGKRLRTPEEGADTVVWLATAEVPSGRFWFDRREARTHWLPWTRETPEDRAALWGMVEALVR